MGKKFDKEVADLVATIKLSDEDQQQLTDAKTAYDLLMQDQNTVNRYEKLKIVDNSMSDLLLQETFDKSLKLMTADALDWKEQNKSEKKTIFSWGGFGAAFGITLGIIASNVGLAVIAGTLLSVIGVAGGSIIGSLINRDYSTARNAVDKTFYEKVMSKIYQVFDPVRNELDRLHDTDPAVQKHNNDNRMQQRLGDLEKQSETLNNEITDLRQKLATAPAFNTAANGNASVPASPVATTPVVQTPAAPDINKKA